MLLYVVGIPLALPIALPMVVDRCSIIFSVFHTWRRCVLVSLCLYGSWLILRALLLVVETIWVWPTAETIDTVTHGRLGMFVTLIGTNENFWKAGCGRLGNKLQLTSIPWESQGNSRNTADISSIVSGNLKAPLKTCVIFNHACRLNFTLCFSHMFVIITLGIKFIWL